MRRFWISDFGFGIGHRVGFKAKGARSILTSRFPPSTERKSAFTLVELMGVMAIIGILSAVLLPSLISRIEDANSVGEDANLEEIARALVAGIKARGTIPNPTTPNFDPGSWTEIALNYTTLGQTALASVLPANNGRQIILSANLATYVAANGYTTPANGWPNPLPNDLKIYILASSKNGLPLQAGIPVADIANWTKVFNAGTGTVAVPASVFGAANTTKGEFLHVKVVDLNQLFCRVELTDTACPPTAIINIGTDDYLNPNVQFFGNLATFNIYDLNLAPIAPARAILNTDLAVLINPLPQFINRTTPLNLVNINGRQNVALSTQSGATPVLNPQPRFLIPISGAVPPPPGNMFPANIQAFYVLKATALELWGSASTGSVLTTTIESDCSFKYFGATWSRVD